MGKIILLALALVIDRIEFLMNESHTDRGEELEAMRTVVDSNIDVEVFRSLFNTSTIWLDTNPLFFSWSSTFYVVWRNIS